MIARLIAWSARNLLLIFIGAAFAVAAGVYVLRTLPLDAIPDLSDVQVIVYTDYPGQAPQVVEDQVTYQLTTSMLTVPKSKVVRGFSFFGVSFLRDLRGRHRPALGVGPIPFPIEERTTIEQLRVACRHVDELMAAGITENIGIRLLEQMTEIDARAQRGHGIMPLTARDVSLWSEALFACLLRGRA